MKSEQLQFLKVSGRRRIRISADYLVVVLTLFLFHLSLSTDVSAQDDPVEPAPPPLKIISKEDTTRLDAKKDIKDRTKLSLELMNFRLAGAERLAGAQDFQGMYRELGYFHALMDDALSFLHQRDNGSGKVLDNYKRMELALRGMAPRIEVIRRELPSKYDPYMLKLSGYLRSARAKATDSLFEDSVIPVKKPPVKNPG